MHTSKQLSHTRAFICIAPFFNSSVVSDTLRGLRRNHVSVKIVGIHSGEIRSEYGMSVKPDWSLSSLDKALTAHHDPYLLILPGDTKCATKLITDARVHRMVKSTLNGRGGLVASMSPEIQQMLHNSASLDEVGIKRFLAKGSMSMSLFIDKMVAHLANWQPII